MDESALFYNAQPNTTVANQRGNIPQGKATHKHRWTILLHCNNEESKKIKAPQGSSQNHVTYKISVCMNTNLGKMHKSSKHRFKLAALLGKKERNKKVCVGEETCKNSNTVVLTNQYVG